MMLSADYVILSASGDAYPYPRPFVVYSYHISLFLDYFKKHPLDLFRLEMAHILKKFNIPYSRLQKLSILQNHYGYLGHKYFQIGWQAKGN